MSKKSILPLGVALLFVAGTTATAQPRPRPCAADIKAYCTDIEPGEGRVAACIKEHIGDFSPACKVRLIRAIATTRECAADVKGVYWSRPYQPEGQCLPQGGSPEPQQSLQNGYFGSYLTKEIIITLWDTIKLDRSDLY